MGARVVRDDPDSAEPLPAGDFGSWIVDMRAAIRGHEGTAVPCGDCTACCTASQFIHIGPDEADALAHIPRALLFRAPRLPPGHLLLGYDERGHCPMLIDGRCSIYEHRPRTCRVYDCRIFAAAGLEPDDGQGLIARRTRRWQFSFPTVADTVTRDAVRAAATFIGQEAGGPGMQAPANATQSAVLAINIHEAFLGEDQETGQPMVVSPDRATVRASLKHQNAGGTIG